MFRFPLPRHALWLLLAALGSGPARAQEARLIPAEEVVLPGPTDGNCPAFWWDGQLRLFTSIGSPQRISEAESQFGPWESRRVQTGELRGKAIWIESVWLDDDGTLFGWYHHEPVGLYPDSTLTVPMIGAVVSHDGGLTVRDLGIVLESGDDADDASANGFFAGGVGDFSVVPDREGKFFYFYFTNYGGPEETQGVSVARLAFGDRFHPVGRVRKYFDGAWSEPGLGGRSTPILGTSRAWRHADPDSFWGPSVHWNTHLGCFVMLVNRAQGDPGWAQEGVYVSFASDPVRWSTPKRLLGRDDIPGWSSFYPQVIGLGPRGTDAEAGRVARFYLKGVSNFEIEFRAAPDAAPDELRPAPGNPRRGDRN